MNEVIVRIWDRDEYDEYTKRDSNGLHLGRFISWHAAIIPNCGDCVVANGEEREITKVEKKIFEPKNGKLWIDIIVQLEVIE